MAETKISGIVAAAEDGASSPEGLRIDIQDSERYPAKAMDSRAATTNAITKISCPIDVLLKGLEADPVDEDASPQRSALNETT